MIQILDFNWKKDNNEFFPIMKTLNTDNLEIATLKLGADVTVFNYKLSLEKFCCGYRENKFWHKCLNANERNIGLRIIKDSDYQCFDCEKREGFKSAFFYRQVPNESMDKHLEQTHYIYLAYFLPNIIKVGTVAESRKGFRQIEQDALFYSYIAESDGFKIQSLERQISKLTNTTETVRSSQKFKNLNSKINIDLAKRELKSKIIEIQQKFQDTEFADWLYKMESIKYIDTTENPRIYYPTEKVSLLDVKEFKNDKYIPLVGGYIGLRGNYLLFKNEEKILSFNTNFLVGRKIDYLAEYSYKQEVDQLGLI